jgi:hypothetical protein
MAAKYLLIKQASKLRPIEKLISQEYSFIVILEHKSILISSLKGVAKFIVACTYKLYRQIAMRLLKLWARNVMRKKILKTQTKAPSLYRGF